VILERLDSLEPLDLMELQDLLVNPDQMGRLDKQDKRGLLDLQAVRVL